VINFALVVKPRFLRCYRSRKYWPPRRTARWVWCRVITVEERNEMLRTHIHVTVELQNCEFFFNRPNCFTTTSWRNKSMSWPTRTCAYLFSFDRILTDTGNYSATSNNVKYPPSPLLAVPNVTAHPSTASVLTSYYLMWQYNCLCTLKAKPILTVVLRHFNSHHGRSRWISPLHVDASSAINLVCPETLWIRISDKHTRNLYVAVIDYAAMHYPRLNHYSGVTSWISVSVLSGPDWRKRTR